VSRPRCRIEHIKLSGFKSIAQAEIDLGGINVLIGANGAGKSNLISFFRMLTAALNDRLDDYVIGQGGANAILHFGAKRTKVISSAITLTCDDGRATSHMQATYQPPDRLKPVLRLKVEEGPTARVRRACLSGLQSQVRVYHFHDTALTAPIRQPVYLNDNDLLREDAGNLAAMLYLYHERLPAVYQRVRAAVRDIAPFFDDFAIAPQRLNPRNVLLDWRARDSDYLFGPHQLSDGTLRAIALVTVLLQPEDSLPDILVIDEPELGLHPSAVEIIAGLVRAAALKSQVILATQSTALLDHFEPEDVIVTDIEVMGLDRGRSRFRRLDPADLADWLTDYSVSELWQKNVIGGGPMP
jgi:predicted ATPase